VAKIRIKRAVIVEYEVDENDGAYFGMSREEIADTENEMSVGVYLEQVDVVMDKDHPGFKSGHSIVGVTFHE
jgi:hypothetical protein